MLARDERAETLRAAVLIPLCALAIRTIALPRLLRMITARAARRPAPGRHRSAISVRAIDRASAHGTGGACLTRSVALMYLLARRGRVTTLKIGARRITGGLAAHAWVEADGIPLNDPADVRAAYALLAQKETAA